MYLSLIECYHFHLSLLFAQIYESVPAQSLQGSTRIQILEIFRNRPNHAVRLPGPSQLYRFSWEFYICAVSHQRTQPVAYLSGDGSTDKGSSSSQTGSLSRFREDIILLAY